MPLFGSSRSPQRFRLKVWLALTLVGAPTVAIEVRGRLSVADEELMEGVVVEAIAPAFSHEDQIALLRNGLEKVVASTTPDRLGWFSLDVPASYLTIRVRAPRILPMTTNLELVTGPRSVPELELHEAQVATSRLLDQKGLPVANARLLLSSSVRRRPVTRPSRWNWQPTPQWLRSDEDGRFSAPVGDSTSIVVYPQGGRQLVVGPLEGHTPRRLAVDIEPAAVTFQVLSPRGEPAPAVLSLDGFGFPIAMSDERGEMTVALSADREVALLDERGNWAVGSVGLPGPDSTPPRMRLQEAILCRGRVVADGGVAVAGALVHLGASVGTRASVQRLVESAIDGSFSIAVPAADQYRFQVSRAGFVTYENFGPEGCGGEAEQVVLLERAAELRGRVVDSAGNPVVGALLEGEESGIGSGAMRRRMFRRFSPPIALAAEDGEFVLSGLFAGTLHLEVTAAGFADVSLPVDLVKGDTTWVEVEIGEGAVVSGSVVASDRGDLGEPRSGLSRHRGAR